MARKFTKGLILLLFLIVATDSMAKDVSAYGTDPLNLKTDDVTYFQIDSTGQIFMSGFSSGRIPFFGASGLFTSNSNFTFNGAAFSFPLTSALIMLGNGTNIATPTAISGDLTLDNTGNAQIAAGVITDADVNASADLQRTKIASGMPNYVLINNGSGVFSEEQFLDKSRGGAGADQTNVTFPSIGVLMTRIATETISGKTMAEMLTFTEIATKPPAPAAGFVNMYCRTDDDCYKQNDANEEKSMTDTGGGGGGTGDSVACVWQFLTTANCIWVGTTGTSFAEPTTDTDCPGPTVIRDNSSGTCESTDVDLPRMTLTNGPIGEYTMFCSATLIGTSGAGQMQAKIILTDGTDDGPEITVGVSTGEVTDIGSKDLYYENNYGSVATRTFQIETRIAATPGTFNIENNNLGENVYCILKIEE